jgi:hypothetical protein
MVMELLINHEILQHKMKIFQMEIYSQTLNSLQSRVLLMLLTR